jgi:hypothetical protein
MAKRRSAAIVASVVLPAAAAMFVGIGAASAAASLVITNQGPATDNSGHVTAGWTAYELSVQADPGELVAAVDLAARINGSPHNGIFGALLQDWHPGKSGPTPTAVGDAITDTNGADNGTDTHWLVNNIFVAAPQLEDSDGVNPAGAPANDAGNIWGTGSYLTGAIGFGGADQVNLQPLAYFVARAGAVVNISLDLAQRLPGGDVDSVIPHLTASVPEPLTGGSLLGCVAGAGVLRSRRRK